MSIKPIILTAVLGLLPLVGCTQHRVTVDPIEVRPIHMTVDINIKIDRELDDFFAFEDELKPTGRSAGQGASQ